MLYWLEDIDFRRSMRSEVRTQLWSEAWQLKDVPVSKISGTTTKCPYLLVSWKCGWVSTAYKSIIVSSCQIIFKYALLCRSHQAESQWKHWAPFLVFPDYFVQKKCWLCRLDFFSGVVAVTGQWIWVFIVGCYRNDFNHVIPDAVCVDLCAMELSRVLILLPDSSLSLKVTGKCCQWNWATSAMTRQQHTAILLTSLFKHV